MDNTFDKMFYAEGDLIGGIDESGVSDIAGPLIAACVILPKIDLKKDDLRIFDIDDCKRIPKRLRKKQAEIVWESALAIGIGEVSPSEFDFLGSIKARQIAMVRALVACKSTARGKPTQPNFLLVDGSFSVPVNIKQANIPDCDQKSLCVASASIVAKVYRDEVMIKLHERFPYYGWISNKGYPCDEHFKGIDKYGAQIGIHRIKKWPFITNENFPEDNRIAWKNRRRRWREITLEQLGKEIGGETLWTTKPPSSNPFQSFKTPLPKEATSGMNMNGAECKLEESQTPATSV